MKIELTNAGKRYNREWIFRGATLQFTSGISYAITGSNGSGKSTLLQALAGMLELSEGSVEYYAETTIKPELIFTQLSFCAPYLELIEEMTLDELLIFHSRFKPFLKNLSAEDICEIVGLQAARTKQIINYSSGMKQRAKLALAIFSNTPVVLLDEPCSNLDQNGVELYHDLIINYCSDRIVIVCSNDQVEYDFCAEIVHMQDFKKVQVSALASPF